MHGMTLRTSKNVKYNLDLNSHNDPAQYKLRELYKSCIVVSIEDTFDQVDWATLTSFLSRLDIQIMRDDHTDTNPKKSAQVVEKKTWNCLLLKVS